jgi:chromosome segregation ATPase
MATIEERVRTLETRADTLETWAGPGQVEALVQGQRDLRRQLAHVQRVQERHTRMLAGLTLDVAGLKTEVAGLQADMATVKADVAGLKTDVAGLKADLARVEGLLQEILRRLPPQPAQG